MKRIIKLRESQLKAVMGPSFEYLNEMNTAYSIEDGEINTEDNPSQRDNCPQVGATPVMQNDSEGIETGNPAVTDFDYAMGNNVPMGAFNIGVRGR